MMMIRDFIGKLFAGERDGLTIWKVMLCDIQYEPITDPSEGVLVASLAENILRFGLLQPILIRKAYGARGAEKYCLVAGRRRLEAVRMLGHTHVPAILIACDDERAIALSLSENLLRKAPHYMDLSSQIVTLLKNGWSAERLANALAMTVAQLSSLAKLSTLPHEELCAFRRLAVSEQDALRLIELAPDLRKAMLSKCERCPDTNLSRLIDEMQDTSDVRLTQTFKWAVNDPRVFLNSLERSAEAMREAGFDLQIHKRTQEDRHVLTIEVAKNKGTRMRANAHSQDVSRETPINKASSARFSSVLNIFEALAEDERGIGTNVSRETMCEETMNTK